MGRVGGSHTGDPDPERPLGWADLVAAPPTGAGVLVVDDDLEARRSLQRLIERYGHHVHTASSAEEAEAWMIERRFDLLLLDIGLPRMDGLAFLRRALQRDPETAVLMLTGVDDPDVAVRCIDAGARSYLVKPVESEVLRLALRDALLVRRLLVEWNRATG